ncbi:MAG TPA: MMPL family transporter [Pseudomonadales bacterium]
MAFNLFARAYRAVVLERPRTFLMLLTLLVAFMALNIPSVRLDASADTLVLEGDTALEYFREVNARYDAEDFLLVTYSPHEALFSDVVLSRLVTLRDELAQVPGVSSVVSILDVPLLLSPKVSISDMSNGFPTLLDPRADRALAEQEFATSPIYKSLLSSTDARTTALQVNLIRDERYFELLAVRESLRKQQAAGPLTAEQKIALVQAEKRFSDYSAQLQDGQAQLVSNVRAVLSSHHDEAGIFLGGVPMIAVDMVRFVRSDLVVFGTGILAFIVLLLAFFFRRWRWIILPLMTCAYSALFMLGYLGWVDWHLTVISANFVALLLIITLSVTIHLVVRYRELESEKPDASQEELVWAMASLMFKPCLYTSLTTLVAFASFVVSGIRPVIDFGWMMTVGVTVAMIMAFLVLPAGLMLLPREDHRPTGRAGAGLTLLFARVTHHYGRWILLASALTLAISVYGITQLKVENRFIDYFNESTEIYQGMEVIDRQLGGTIPLEIIIDAPAEETLILADDPFAEPDPFAEVDPFAVPGDAVSQRSAWFNRNGLDQLEEINDWLDGLPETGKVLSPATLYKTVRELMGGRVDDIQLALVQQSLPDNVRKALLDPYLNEERREARFVLRVMETSRTLNRNELLQVVHDKLTGDFGLPPERVHITGMLVLYNNMLQSLFRSQILTLGFVFFAIMLMFMVLFRSLLQGLIALAPNVLAALIVLGGMGLAGIPLDMMTITIAAITIGIGVDDTIHYVHRFGSEFKKDRNYLATMYRCHGSIGKAMYYTSVTIVLGFSILMLSNFRPSIYFGALTAFAMIVALMGAQLLLPRLILLLKPFGPESASGR